MRNLHAVCLRICSGPLTHSRKYKIIFSILRKQNKHFCGLQDFTYCWKWPFENDLCAKRLRIIGLSYYNYPDYVDNMCISNRNRVMQCRCSVLFKRLFYSPSTRKILFEKYMSLFSLIFVYSINVSVRGPCEPSSIHLSLPFIVKREKRNRKTRITAIPI